MKYISFFCWISVFLLAACADPAIPEWYQPIPPELPGHWRSVLGEPEWHIAWTGRDDRVESVYAAGNAPLPGIRLGQERAGMVLAWPCWPGRDLPAGIMRPAGAIFPHDAREGKILLSWEAGPEAHLFLLMAARTSPGEGTGIASAIPAKNRPWNFDWPRFRSLMKSDLIPPEIQEDPWLADWPLVARRTIESGFDRRRIKPPPNRKPLSVEIPRDGPWIGTSPFAPAWDWKAGDTAVLEAGDAVETLVSPGGRIRYRNGIWLWIGTGE